QFVEKIFAGSPKIHRSRRFGCARPISGDTHGKPGADCAQKRAAPMKKPHVRSRLARSFVRQLVRRLHGYVPGEQPKISGLIKLNTNESPYPPSPRVLKAVKTAVNGRLRLYPNPTAQPLREKLAKFHKCNAENIIVGNGSDELLALATRAFVDPATDGADRVASGRPAGKLGKSTIQYFAPSYSLYPVLASIHGARAN